MKGSSLKNPLQCRRVPDCAPRAHHRAGVQWQLDNPDVAASAWQSCVGVRGCVSLGGMVGDAVWFVDGLRVPPGEGVGTRLG